MAKYKVVLTTLVNTPEYREENHRTYNTDKISDVIKLAVQGETAGVNVCVYEYERLCYRPIYQNIKEVSL